ncbi:uncharacterized protein LOC141565457 [Sminthopsis crassicaudata]|uniref:uncharacterized protein LOC141565457 n=1 Tax=Sminthopsis crassicaudata TaxID=9301 RepID=UPI003D695990
MGAVAPRTSHSCRTRALLPPAFPSVLSRSLPGSPDARAGEARELGATDGRARDDGLPRPPGRWGSRPGRHGCPLPSRSFLVITSRSRRAGASFHAKFPFLGCPREGAFPEGEGVRARVLEREPESQGGARAGPGGGARRRGPAARPAALCRDRPARPSAPSSRGATPFSHSGSLREERDLPGDFGPPGTHGAGQGGEEEIVCVWGPPPGSPRTPLPGLRGGGRSYCRRGAGGGGGGAAASAAAAAAIRSPWQRRALPDSGTWPAAQRQRATLVTRTRSANGVSRGWSEQPGTQDSSLLSVTRRGVITIKFRLLRPSPQRKQHHHTAHV